MAKPKCPQCGSTNVVPSLAKNSHDNCVACGYSDFVAKFYERSPAFRSVKASDPIANEFDLFDPAGVLDQEALRKTQIKPVAQPIQGNPRKPYWWEKD